MRRPLLALLLCAAAHAAPPPGEIDLETIARDTARDLVDGKLDALEARFTPQMRQAVPRERIAAVLDPLRERAPARSVVVRTRDDHPDGSATFLVKGHWTRGAVSDIRVTLDPKGAVTGLFIRDEEAPPDRFDRYQTKAKLRPPFDGTWTARNAARDAKNPHFGIPAQRFAVDWLIEEHGRSYRTDGRGNADYYCYGKDALAPAAGTVAVVVDGIPENRPGQHDTYFVPGNHVVIDLGGGEFAMFMHLQPGSIRVKVGDRVGAGDVVGKVGNSGNSSEPHLHFEIADRPRLVEATSLPAQFTDVLLDGKRAARAFPSEGDTLAPAR